VLVSGRGLWSGLSFLAATESALASKRDVLADFLERVVRAQVWANQNVADFSATLARIIGISPEAARLQFERRHQAWRALDDTILAEQQRTADFYWKAGLLRQRLEVGPTFAAGFGLPV
jgi:sulfonate transport system substrate-binding protein